MSAPRDEVRTPRPAEPDVEGQAAPPHAAKGPGVLPRSSVQVVVLLALCAVLFVAGLGHRGLAYTEGHRVGPAWAMLDAGPPWEARDAWLVPRLFEAPYLRKPPGMLWAIAASSALLGRTEMAARLPSAIAMTVLVLVAWRVTTRWVGSPWGLAAGIAQALFPFFWSSARSAEIEMLHASGTGIAALLLADAMLRGDRHRWLSALGAGLGIAVMTLAKGPAGLPVVLAAPVGVCLACRSIAPLARPSLALVLVVPGLALGALAWGIYDALGRLTEPVITQGVGEFLWDSSRLDRILTLPIVALASMAPASLGLLLIPWRARAIGAAPGEVAARSLGLACLLAVGAYTLIGISNPRYTLPAATLLPPIAAWAIAGIARRAADGGFDGMRRRAARVLALGSAWTWAVVLTAGFVGFLRWYEGPRGRTSGDIPGAALAAILERDAQGGATVWADDLVECRPEVLLYARRWTSLLRIRWQKPIESVRPGPGDILIVRTDRHGLANPQPSEADRAATLIEHAALVHRFDVHKYSFQVWRVGGTEAADAPAMPGS